MLGLCGHGVLAQQKQLKHRQLQQGTGGGDPVARGGALLLQLLLFVRGDLPEAELLPAHIDHVPGLHRQSGGPGLGGLDPDAALGENVVDPPVALVATAEHRMHAAHARVHQAHVRVDGPADDVLPVGEGEGILAVAEIAPGLRLVVFGEHGADAADDHGDRKQNQNVFAHGERIVGKTLRAEHLPSTEIKTILFYHTRPLIDKRERVN